MSRIFGAAVDALSNETFLGYKERESSVGKRTGDSYGSSQNPDDEQPQQPSKPISQATLPTNSKNKTVQTADENTIVWNLLPKLHDYKETETNVARANLDNNKISKQLGKSTYNPGSIINKLKEYVGTPQQRPTDKLLGFTNAKEKTETEFQNNRTRYKIEIKNDEVEMHEQGLSNESIETSLKLNRDFRRSLKTAVNIANSSKETTVNTDIARSILNYENHEEVTNKPVLDKNALTYELEKFPKNAMIIFNHEIFLDGDDRPGTAQDEEVLRTTFEQFRFEVETCQDFKKEELLAKMREFGKQKFDDYGCICIAILTHGNDHGFLKASDVRYTEREVFACFNTQKNSSLVAKPIIFLIQACRGRKLANSVQPQGPIQEIETDIDIKKGSAYELPTEADLIIFHSCFFGRASGRDPNEGTWFIQTVCKEINRHASEEHLEDIFRRVRRIIAVDKGHKHAKQMPVTTSTLLRELYLARNGDLGSKCSTKTKLYVNKHAFAGVAFAVLTIAYCYLLYSSLERRHVYIFTSSYLILTALLLNDSGLFDVSGLKRLVMLAFLFIFLNITGLYTWAILYGSAQTHNATKFEFSFLF